MVSYTSSPPTTTFFVSCLVWEVLLTLTKHFTSFYSWSFWTYFKFHILFLMEIFLTETMENAFEHSRNLLVEPWSKKNGLIFSEAVQIKVLE